MLFLVVNKVLDFPRVAEMVFRKLFVIIVEMIFFCVELSKRLLEAGGVVSLQCGPYQPVRHIFAPVLLSQL